MPKTAMECYALIVLGNRSERVIRPPHTADGATCLMVLALAAAFALTSCTGSSDEACIADLNSHRASIHADFAHGEDSPLGEEQKASFTGLRYFPAAAERCVDATFAVVDDDEIVDMPTFNEESIPFRRFGTFTFRIGWKRYSLTAFQRMDLPEAERQWVLVPFKDKTNRHETYGGGRYLEIDLPIDSSTTIDFNRASNPWCAYDPGYVCPVPPRENWLDVRIEAGEKAFKATQESA